MPDSIVQCFRRCVAERGSEEALWSRGEDRRMSFAELAREVEAWTGRLEGEERGPVALATGNCVAFVAAFLALRALDRPVLLMDGGLPPDEKVGVARQLGVRRLLHRDEAGEALADGVRTTFVEGPARPLPPGTGLVKLTSGSTGRPAGVCFDDAALLAGIRQITDGMSIRPADRVLVVIPLSHSYGFDNGILSLAVHGTPLVLEPSYFPGPVLRALEEGGIDFLPLVPPLVRSLGGATWPRDLALRTVICAGGVLRPETAAAFHRASGLRVHDFYGSTETGGISFERHPEQSGATGTVGRPLPGVRVGIDDAGRLTVASAANLIGVVGETVRRPVRTVTMGDTARLEPDGRVRLTGRTAHVLNVGGRKVAASKVEAALAACPGVVEAAVVGVDDPVRGDRTVAFLVASSWPVDLAGVPRDLVPREVRHVAALPYTDRGKLDRARLREIARQPEGEGNGDSDPGTFR